VGAGRPLVTEYPWLWLRQMKSDDHGSQAVIGLSLGLPVPNPCQKRFISLRLAALRCHFQKPKRPARMFLSWRALERLKLGAGAGFEPATFRL
jgi:hypothetical protein